MIEIRSSWIIADGVVTPLGERPRKLNSHACVVCGVSGHNARTCGMTDDERKARQR